jgi:hypothetical protein
MYIIVNTIAITDKHKVFIHDAFMEKTQRLQDTKARKELKVKIRIFLNL